jgi:hypothetical protein
MASWGSMFYRRSVFPHLGERRRSHRHRLGNRISGIPKLLFILHLTPQEVQKWVETMMARPKTRAALSPDAVEEGD